MDALGLISGPDAEKWRKLMLVHNEELLKGAKAPDAVFKDFKNHVLHVGEGEWGGARDAAMAWYAEAVGHLQEKKWDKAIYALGVMSHYMLTRSSHSIPAKPRKKALSTALSNGALPSRVMSLRRALTRWGTLRLKQAMGLALSLIWFEQGQRNPTHITTRLSLIHI